jgi:ferredoxin
VDRSTFQTPLPAVFAGGGLIGRGRLAVKSVADGKNAALAVHQFLTDGRAVGKPPQFHSRLGTLTEQEWRRFVDSADPSGRVEPADLQRGFTQEEAMAEARRCLHCDCRKKKNCKLRQLSAELKPAGGTYKGQRREYARADSHPDVVFESGKCIQCGLCVQVLKKNGLSEGLTFRGRGFGMQIAAALDAAPDLTAGQAARLCVQVCPTGAWAFKNR